MPARWSLGKGLEAVAEVRGDGEGRRGSFEPKRAETDIVAGVGLRERKEWISAFGPLNFA